MEITKQVFDTLQFNLQCALDDIIRLKARVTALEGGEALPPDQTVTVTPQPQPMTCEAHIMQHAPAPAPVAQSDIDTELDLTRGMTAGGRRA